jgi:succinate dehydrogenase / fumarate reductase, membrane anchor subunit
MATRMISRRGVPVTAGSRFELYAWLFMRISGLILILMAVFHFLYMHFYIQVDTINYDVIALRWHSPFWRVYDFVLLAFGFTHAMNGLRIVLSDYVPNRALKPVLAILLIFYVALILMGAWIIFTFKQP